MFHCWWAGCCVIQWGVEFNRETDFDVNINRERSISEFSIRDDFINLIIVAYVTYSYVPSECLLATECVLCVVLQQFIRYHLFARLIFKVSMIACVYVCRVSRACVCANVMSISARLTEDTHENNNSNFPREQFHTNNRRILSQNHVLSCLMSHVKYFSSAHIISYTIYMPCGRPRYILHPISNIHT